MGFFDVIGDNIKKTLTYLGHQKNEFFNEVNSYIGSVIDLTALEHYIEESGKLYKQNVEESPNLAVQQRWGILGLISSINKTALFVLKQISKSFETIPLTKIIRRNADNIKSSLNSVIKDNKEAVKEIDKAIKGFTILEFAINLISLVELKKIYTDIKEFPKQFQEAVKTHEIAKVILSGFGLLSKITKVPITIVEAITPLADWIGKIDLIEILKFDKWAPSLGAASLILSVAFGALKIWDLHDTFKFADKMKEKCCLELLRNMEKSLKNEFTGNKPLLAKLELALAFDKGKQLKKIHKKELAFQNELSKEMPDPEVLLKFLNELDLPNKQSQTIVEQLKSTISLYQLNQCLSQPNFKQTVLETTSQLLDQTSKEMEILIKKGENIDLNVLKKQFKHAAAEINPELLNQINRSAKLAYLNVIGDYNAKKLKSVYQVEGEKIQGAVKKTVSLANSLLNKNEFRLADEKLSIAYKELKGRVTYKTFGSVVSLVINAVGMAAASITLAISAGSLATPAAPVGVALGILASALGLALAFYNTYKTVRFQESIGIVEMNLQEKLKKQIDKIGKDHPFYKSLSPEQYTFFNYLKKQVGEGEFNKHIFFNFAVPEINRNSTSDEILKQKTAKKMNRLIKSMNEWNVKKESIQERILVKHWSVELKKIDTNFLPAKPYENFRLNLLRAVENKEFYRLGKIQPIPIKKSWNRQQKETIQQMNILIDSMHDAAEKRFEKSIDNLSNKIKMINYKFRKDPKLKTRDSQHFLKELEKQCELDKRILIELKSRRRKDS